ncbi:importin-9-like [Daphnia pulex]|uniref:importin-9-like n=1 Tax=Daphnia pulex TaxID=6669 RepID=UPI001EDDA12A|nr:importin-9-like [Daphnia pulex]
MMYLTQGSQESLQGSMCVLLEVTHNVDDKQMPQVVPVIFPEVYKIFSDSSRYNVRMRSQAIQIFTNLTESVCSAGEYNKGLVKELLGPFLLPFTEALVKHLQEPDGPASDVGLKTAIVKALTVLVKHVPKQLSQCWLLQILPTVWNTLTHSAHVYVACVVNETEESDELMSKLTQTERLSASKMWSPVSLSSSTPLLRLHGSAVPFAME